MAKKGKSAIVTGGGSGIGLAIARSLVVRGHDVTICGRGADKLNEAADEAGAVPVPCDVSKADEVDELFAVHIERTGGIDVLANNAGIAWGGSFEDIAEADWDRVIEIDLKGVFLCSQRAIPQMKRQGSGHIFNISSVSGKRGQAHMAPYNAAKFGVIGLTETLSKELEREGIRACAICPAMVATPMIGGVVAAEELISPEDIARTVGYCLDLGPNASPREIVVWRTGH